MHNFAHILSLLYTHSECDFILLAGDLNSRIGELKDIINDTDSIPFRNVLDKIKSQHGQEMVEFLIELRFCVLNGRSANDGFTSVSTKGKSVVDYLCFPHDVFRQCKDFRVIQIQTIIDNYNLHGLLGKRSRIPDHVVIMAQLCTNNLSVIEKDHPTNGPTDDNTRLNLPKIPYDFMSRVTAARAFHELISAIELSLETQNDIDNLYSNLTDAILNEMENSVPKYSTSKKTNKRFKKNKPYWNDKLQHKWETLREKEKRFLKCCSGKSLRERKQQEFKKARDAFDKLLRQSEREYRRSVASGIESMVSENPNEF